MRSAVVFPDPDGPTRTMNSASSTWRSRASTAGTCVPGYILVAAAKRTSAIGTIHAGVQPRRLDLVGGRPAQGVDGGRQLRARPRLGLRPGAELVQRQQGSADDRRRRVGVHDRFRGGGAQALLD